MTASPGSDIEKMDEICRNLSLKRIDMRSEYDPDVSPYVYDVNVEKIEVNMPKDLTDVISLLKMLTKIRCRADSSPYGPEQPPRRSIFDGGRNLQAPPTARDSRFSGAPELCIKTLHAVSLAEVRGAL